MVSHKNNNEVFKKTLWVLSGCLLLLFTWVSGIAGDSFPLVAPQGVAKKSVITPDKAHNLSLAAQIPAGLSISAGDIGWQIRALDGSLSRQVGGRSPQLSLPVGKYDIGLRIGTYEEHKVVEVFVERVTDSVFAASIGRLRASSDVEAEWKIMAQQGADTGRTLMSQEASPQISTIVAAGDYNVVATLEDGVSDTQRVKVVAGQVSTTKIQMPTGKVSLIATLGNGPALRPMSWTVYRLDGGRQTVAAPRRHSATLVVSPGHYEAVASLDGQERRRAFTVLTNTSNRIVVAMD